MNFLKNVVAEMKVVTWPSRSQMVSLTGVVLVSIVILALFFGTVDTAIGAAIKSLLSL